MKQSSHQASPQMQKLAIAMMMLFIVTFVWAVITIGEVVFLG